MSLINLYNAKEKLIDLLQYKEAFVGVGITTESADIAEQALRVFVRTIDSPVIIEIPRYFEGYRILYRVVGDTPIQELGFDEDDEIDIDE